MAKLWKYRAIKSLWFFHKKSIFASQQQQKKFQEKKFLACDCLSMNNRRGRAVPLDQKLHRVSISTAILIFLGSFGIFFMIFVDVLCVFFVNFCRE